LVAPDAQGGRSFRILSLASDKDDEADWLLHAAGKFYVDSAEPRALAFEEVEQRCQQEVTGGLDYDQLSRWGVTLGPSFQGLERLWRSDQGEEALGLVQLPEAALAELPRYRLHPALLDACIQTALALKPPDGASPAPDVYLPVSVERLHLLGRPSAQLWSHARLRTGTGHDGELFVVDFDLYDERGEVVAEVEGLHFRRAKHEALRRAGHSGQPVLDESFYEVVWSRKPHAAVPLAPAAQPGCWLIFADREGVAEDLSRRLTEQGDACVLVFPGNGAGPAPSTNGAEALWHINPAEPAQFEWLLQHALPVGVHAWRGAVHLWSLDLPPSGTLDGPHLRASQALTCRSVLYLAQAHGKMGRPALPMLCLVTRGVQPVQNAEALAVAQAPLWGLGKTIGLEYPDLTCLRVDLDPHPGSGEGHPLWQELMSPDGEDQVALRRGDRYVARLARRANAAQPVQEQADERPVRLAVTAHGRLDSLVLQPAERRRPGPGEVEIRVRATGLNFRDVLKALGMYPGDAESLGDECAGEIVAVGPGVEQLRVGDKVMGLAVHAFATYVTTRADFVVKQPEGLSFEEAATIPIVYLTAYYALHHLAKLRPGERVLIHAAAGGVGLAAVQLAQRAGAVIFGTAGSPEKRAYLKSIGVNYVMDSRALAFADEVLAVTQGEGVDVVLNSLNGEFIPKNLAALKADGRFLELGKIGIWDAQQVAAVKPGVAYYPIFLAEQFVQEPALIRAMLVALVEQVQAGTLKPLPRHCFALAEVDQAFRFMAQAKHTGKIVVMQPGAAHAADLTALRADATYLITGGVGGLGLATARWLVERGACHLVLVGRRGATAAAQCQAVQELESAGAEVVVAQVDVSDEAEVRRLLAEIDQTMPPLRGLIHAAGVLDDGMLQQQSWAQFAQVMAPKVLGAWHLHRLTQDKALDFFVLFSSGASLLGSPGQASYTAANTFLDVLAHERRGRGLPALSINWGPWAEVGMAAEIGSQYQQRWAKLGLIPITPEQGVELLGRALQSDAAQIAALPIHWPAYLGSFGGRRVPPLLQGLAEQAQPSRREPGARQHGPELLAALAGAPEHERRTLLLAYLREQVRGVLALDASMPIADQQPLAELGLDSLMAVEFRTRLAASLGVTLSVADLLQGHSLSQIGTTVLTQLAAMGALEPAREPAPEPAAGQEWEVLTL
jgi:myxalamid-type polyketide synthase MxaB